MLPKQQHQHKGQQQQQKQRQQRQRQQQQQPETTSKQLVCDLIIISLVSFSLLTYICLL